MNLEVSKEIKSLETALNIARENLKLLPHGTLRCTSSNGSDQFFVNGKYMPKDMMNVIGGIAQREYLEKLIPTIEKELYYLRGYDESQKEKRIENVFNNQCEARKKIVEPIMEPIESIVEHFMSEEYEPLGFDPNDKTELYSAKGERVRSKAERIIADELIRYNIPYRYEKPLTLTSWGESVTVRPDFTVLNLRTRKTIIFEHLGMLDSMSYVEKNIPKLDLYEKNGYLLGENLICTHETSKVPLSTGVLDRYIETFFM